MFALSALPHYVISSSSSGFNVVAQMLLCSISALETEGVAHAGSLRRVGMLSSFNQASILIGGISDSSFSCCCDSAYPGPMS